MLLWNRLFTKHKKNNENTMKAIEPFVKSIFQYPFCFLNEKKKEGNPSCLKKKKMRTEYRDSIKTG